MDRGGLYSRNHLCTGKSMLFLMKSSRMIKTIKAMITMSTMIMTIMAMTMRRSMVQE